MGVETAKITYSAGASDANRGPMRGVSRLWTAIEVTMTG